MVSITATLMIYGEPNPGRESPHLKVVHMIGSNGCFLRKFSLAAGLHFQEKSLATGAKVFHFPLDAGIDFVILI